MRAPKTKKKPRVGPGRLSAAQAEALPDRLLDAAFGHFTEVGYEGATMDQIAKRAGASTKTLYSRYGNKAEILEAVVMRNVERTVAEHLRFFALNPEEVEPRDYLYKLAIQIGVANLADETAGLVRITFSEAYRFPVLRRLYREVTGRAIGAIARALVVWRDQDKVDFREDPEVLAALCFGALTDGMRIRAVLGDPMSRSELEKQVSAGLDVFLRGIAAQPKVKKRTSK